MIATMFEVWPKAEHKQDYLGQAASRKQLVEHLAAQAMGRDQWYAQYTTRICKVEREYSYIRES